MKSLAEVAADLNAIKQERSHTRVIVPNDVQQDENYRLIGELLKGTGVGQDELAGLSLNVGTSAVQALDAMSADGGIDGMEMIGLIASLWIDGVILGARYGCLYASANGTRDSEPPRPSEAGNGQGGAENPVSGPSPERRAAQGDPRGERDR